MRQPKRKPRWRVCPKSIHEIMYIHLATRSHHISKWYIRTPRLRRIRLQDFKGRLYLIGMLLDGMTEILPFECTIHTIVSKYGFPLAA